MAVYAPLTWGTVDNASIESMLSDTRNRGPNGELWYFFGMAGVNVHNFDTAPEAELLELRRSLKHPGMKGIKLAFVHNELPMDDERYDGIYDIAREFGVPVYHHIGSSPLRKMSDFKTDEERKRHLRSSSPLALEAAIARYPEVPFVMGHMGFDFNREGFDFTDDVYRLAERYPNVYLEISAFGLANYDPEGKFMDSALRNLKGKKLLGRTFYGSDASGQPGAVGQYVKLTLKSMERVGLTTEEARAVMSLNARKMYRLP
jgi:predicted TIM-barrel fold metal-dependent hydrolase